MSSSEAIIICDGCLNASVVWVHVNEEGGGEGKDLNDASLSTTIGGSRSLIFQFSADCLSLRS